MSPELQADVLHNMHMCRRTLVYTHQCHQLQTTRRVRLVEGLW